MAVLVQESGGVILRVAFNLLPALPTLHDSWFKWHMNLYIE